MKRSDLFFIGFIALLFLPFVLSGQLYEFYIRFNDSHGFITSFVKFGLLATAGEMLGLRIRKGVYCEKGFGILPRAIVWGFLGLGIKAAFMIFGSGVPSMLAYLGSDAISTHSVLWGRVLTAFSISLLLNFIFAPVMMTIHKVTDTHIVMKGGTVRGLFSRINVASILQAVDWNVHWNFVLKKTIPLFWVPAHTITFLLPEGSQVLFAAFLGIVLGVILAFAARKGND